MEYANILSRGLMVQPTYHHMKLLSLSNESAKWAVIYLKLYFFERQKSIGNRYKSEIPAHKGKNSANLLYFVLVIAPKIGYMYLKAEIVF